MAVRPLPPELRQRLAPLALVVERQLPVPDALVELLPMGGIQRGWQVGVEGPGGWSVALALWAAALGGDGWLAIVGIEDLGLAAAAEAGVPLDRTVLVGTPPAGLWPEVVAALLEAFDVVVMAGAGMARRDARRLAVRAREQETVVFHLVSGHDSGCRWPEPLDVVLSTAIVDQGMPWRGIGRGHGHLRARSLEVRSSGRRVPGPGRSVVLPLPGQGRPETSLRTALSPSDLPRSASPQAAGVG